MNPISLEPLNQSTSNLVYDVTPPKGRTLLVLGHVQKLRWLPSNFLICMLQTPLVNVISLEPLNHQLQIWFMMSHHLMANTIDFGSCAKTKMAAIKLFNMFAIDTPCERDIFRTAYPVDFKFGL